MNRQQIIAIAVLLALGVAGGSVILSAEPKSAATEEHGEEGGGHKDEHGHDHEGVERVEMNPAKLANANLGLEAAGPATLKQTVKLNGVVRANEDATVQIVPRFPGVIRSIRKRLGEPVQKGETLASIESNESLTVYDVRAPMSGTVIARSASLGEFAGVERAMLTVSDLTSVWVDFSVYSQDFEKFSEGQPVVLAVNGNNGAASGAISYISPFGAEATQTVLARAVIQNPNGKLRPGLFVSGEVQLGEISVPLAVKNEAIQSLEGKSVVFVKEGDAFEAREIEVGNADAERTEVLFGLEPGDTYATANSFVLKAEIGKGEAEHGH